MARRIQSLFPDEPGTTHQFITQANRESLKPFVLFDAGPVPATTRWGLGWHPHSGVATLTFPYWSDLHHDDTGGNGGVIREGGFQWMQAGGGIWHQEMYEPNDHKIGIHQLWVQLPPELETAAVHYANVQPEDVPEVDGVRVFHGEYRGVRGTADIEVPFTYLDVTLAPGATFAFEPPAAQTRGFLFLRAGGATVVGQDVEPLQLATFEATSDAIEVVGRGQTARFVLCLVEPTPHPIVAQRGQLHTNEAALLESRGRIAELGRQLLTRPVGGVVLRMAGPVGVGMLSTFLFQVVDTYFVGFLGSAELAALSFASAVYFLVVSLMMGLAAGTSALVGAALGDGDRSLAQRYTTYAATTVFFVSVAIAAAGVATVEPLFRTLGAEDALVPLIADYMTILYLGMPLLTVGLVGNASVMATGDVLRPEVVMVTAGVLNLVLDVVLIFGLGPIPALRLQGAALATALSWVWIVMAMAVLMWRKGLWTMQWGPTSVAEIRRIGEFSAPAVASQILIPVGAILLTTLAARSGTAVVAAVGIAARVETLMLVGISAMGVALIPVVAQNHGAHLFDRVRGVARWSVRAAMVWGGVAALLLVVAADPIAQVFSDDPEVVWHVRLYFYAVAASYAGLGVVAVTASVLNGAQQPATSFRVLAVKTLLFTVPLTVLGSMFGALGLFVGLSASNLLGALTAWHMLRRALPSNNNS